MGRKPLDDDQRREISVFVRLNGAEMEVIEQAARTAGLSVAAYCRMVALKQARKDAKGSER